MSGTAPHWSLSPEVAPARAQPGLGREVETQACHKTASTPRWNNASPTPRPFPCTPRSAGTRSRIEAFPSLGNAMSWYFQTQRFCKGIEGSSVHVPPRCQSQSTLRTWQSCKARHGITPVLEPERDMLFRRASRTTSLAKIAQCCNYAELASCNFAPVTALWRGFCCCSSWWARELVWNFPDGVWADRDTKTAREALLRSTAPDPGRAQACPRGTVPSHPIVSR